MTPHAALKVLASALIAGSLAFAAPNPSRAEDGALPTDRAGLDAYIRAYILKNPDVVRESLLTLERQEEAARTKRILGGFKSDIYEAGSPEIGDPNAKVTIVEFYDYNCPYCRASYPALKAFLKANPDTKLLLKDVASFGKDSEAAARVALAAARQGKFEALHDALMMRKGQIGEAQALDTAAKLGLDIERLKKDAHSPDTGEALTRTQDLANRLNVTTTPLFVVGYNGIAGAPDDLASQLATHVDEVRASGCDVC